jgi:hypothetical protein
MFERYYIITGPAIGYYWNGNSPFSENAWSSREQAVRFHTRESAEIVVNGVLSNISCEVEHVFNPPREPARHACKGCRRQITGKLRYCPGCRDKAKEERQSVAVLRRIEALRLYGDRFTWKEIGKKLGVSVERARQIAILGLRMIKYQDTHCRSHPLMPKLIAAAAKYNARMAKRSSK